MSRRSVLPVLLAALAGCAEPTQQSRNGAAAAHADEVFTFFVAPRENIAGPAGMRVAEADPEELRGLTKSAVALPTLEAARDKIRILRSRGDLLAAIQIVLLPGTHARTEPFVLEPQDSGTAESPLRIFALGSAKITGAVKLEGFVVNADGRWTLELPAVRRGEWQFSQLYVNGESRPRPRASRNGFFTIAGELPPTAANAARGHDRFQYSAGDLDPNWRALGDVEILAFHLWSMSRLRIASLDPASREVRFTGPTSANVFWAAMPKGNRYIAENVAEALDEPGEWYLERKTGILTYIPKPGEKPGEVEVLAPRATSLVELRGDPEHGKFVEHVSFDCVEFAHTSWVAPPGGYSFPQAEVGLGAAINAVGARNCAFALCRIHDTGEWAVRFGAGCKHNAVEGCNISNLGAGGIQLGETTLRDDALCASDQTIRDNWIEHGGRIHPAAVAVWIGHSPRNLVEHNEIHDWFYTGISVGWSWGYGASGAHHNRIEYNHISQIGQGLLSDMGGIYTLGVSPGTRIVGNRIHDVESFGYGGWGIYTDEGSTGIEIEKNLVYRTKSAGFHQHYGRENVIRNNIFAFGSEAQVMRTRAEDHLSFRFEKNIVLWNRGALLGGNFDGGKFAFDYNCYWNSEGAPVSFGKLRPEDWLRNGNDQHSVMADPLFVDPAAGDFQLREGSPALKTGFEPWNLDDAGISR